MSVDRRVLAELSRRMRRGAARRFHSSSILQGGRTSRKQGKWQERIKQRAWDELKALPLRVGAMEYADRLKQCHGERGLILAQIIHDRIVSAQREQERETYLGNILVRTYGRCGSPERALEAFALIADKNINSWTIMMSALQENGKHQEALDMYRSMVKELADQVNQASLVTALRSCSVLGPEYLKLGKEIHVQALRAGLGADVVVLNSLINMYARCGCFRFAREVFNRMEAKNVISYTTMISAYAHNGCPDEAFCLYKTMIAEGVAPDAYAYAAALAVCPTLDEVVFIHGRLKEIHRASSVVLNALVAAYSRFGRVVEAEMVFDRVRDFKRDVTAWNTMLAAYAKHGQEKKAIELFVEMEGLTPHVKPNTETITQLLVACARVGAVGEGKEAHVRAMKEEEGITRSPELRNALVDLYAKCGCIAAARRVFDPLKTRDVQTYLSMVSGYTLPGQASYRLELYYRMNQEGLAIDAETFAELLGTCRLAGGPDEGWKYFITMAGDYGIAPQAVHFACIAEMLGRAGNLMEAEELIQAMPFHPDAATWTMLLSACKVFNNFRLGMAAGRRALELDPEDCAGYVLLIGLCCRAGKKSEMEETRKKMVARGVTLQKGKCTIEANRQVHEFVPGDVFHPLNEEIRLELKKLHKAMADGGYRPDAEDSALCDGDEEHHSERMAIGLGLALTDAESQLYIIKNSRVCPCCHRAIKFMSKLTGRRIVIRDPRRVHWFARGSCSCGDYW